VEGIQRYSDEVQWVYDNYFKGVVIPCKQGAAYLFHINNIFMPLQNTGITGYAGFNNVSYDAQFDGKNFLYAGGFMISGKAGNEVWANAMAAADRVEDYLPGRVVPQPGDAPQIYVVDAQDPPFGECWQAWAEAVKLGADFHDGDGDGIYSPIDKNGNGVWDRNEDRPDILGHQTAWCVYHDGRPSVDRRWKDLPRGIEIQQTMFGFRSSGPLGNVLFLRYRIFNRGTIAAVMDSVFFSLWADGDLGVYYDDLVGCDTLRNGGFTWNDGPDDDFGANPPCFFIDLLQGPIVYIPGITFTDTNGNGIYDEGIDAPLDTAYNVRGQVLGMNAFPGARNLQLSSFVNFHRSDPVRGSPGNVFTARNYMLGRLGNGDLLDPCTDRFGQVFGIPCTNVPKRFWYSGDVQTNRGWIYTFPGDMRQVQNVGPFQLVKDKPVDIIAAYIVGRGTNARTSVGEAQRISDFVQRFFDSNFDPTVGVKEKPVAIPREFALQQNYPNPFRSAATSPARSGGNPSTTISFSLPTASQVKLQVFDLLGREVGTLVNGRVAPGAHQVEFAPKNLPSGMYFYRLQAGERVAIRKMLLLR
jgi:hypothetical protein